MFDFLKHFPYEETRPLQAEVLINLAELWDKYDVFVIGAPTAAGKTALAKAIMASSYSCSVITPTNQLVQQFLAEFPDTRTYLTWPHYPQTPDGAAQRRRDFAQLKYRRGPGIYNYYMYYAMKAFRDVLVVDEAHGLIGMMQDLGGMTIWQHKVNYPSGITQDRPRFRAWLEKVRPLYSRQKWWKYAVSAMSSEVPQHVLEETTDMWSGGGVDDPETGEPVHRGEEVEMPVIKFKPVDVRDLPVVQSVLPATSKLILMSATIGSKDLEELGLDRRRVAYLRCQHPIPAEQRPVIIAPPCVINYRNLEEATRTIGDIILGGILPEHSGEKGLLHVTYRQQQILRSVLGHDPRFLFHGKLDKMEQFRKFRAMPPESGAVLVASGMYEGVDLPYDAARWQAICKVPWPSLADMATKHKADRDRDWYDWTTYRTLIQACGRVCRTEKDYGVTYLLDGAIYKLLDRSSRLTPQWWRDTLIDAGGE